MKWKWYDRPRDNWLYRAWYRFWLGSWNLNDPLYKVTRRVKITRPLFWNDRGRAATMGPVLMVLGLIAFGYIGYWLNVLWAWLFL